MSDIAIVVLAIVICVTLALLTMLYMMHTDVRANDTSIKSESNPCNESEG